MALKEYKQKRSFKNTPEPEGGKPDNKTLQFVVQKHAASHLHYDFRLEMEGVLKSWAIPKGPSLNPSDKRLAMHVEDHPFDYKNFEGIIPEGNYGAGTVMVWDAGTYEPLVGTDGTKKANDKVLLKELKAGQLKFKLNGKKLKGEFALVQTKGRGDNSWLLIKHRDKYATEQPVIEKDKSIISKKTLEQIAKNPNSAQWQSNKQKTSKSPDAAKTQTAGKTQTGAKSQTATKAQTTTKTASKSPRPLKNAASAPIAKKSAAKTSTKSEKPLLSPDEDTQTIKLAGHELTFNHLNKIFWPKEKYTKRDLLNYYHQVAPYILPYLKNRPQSLNRHPGGINGPSFYQKNVSGKTPSWIKTFPYHTAEDPEEKEFLVCTDEASLLYMISLGCIEINPWSSQINNADNPDWCIIDLDPDKKTPFDKVIEAAQVTRKVLEAAGVESYCKTSGSTGIHIYFPLGGKYSYDHSKEFARLVAELVHSEIPDYTTLERTLSKRKGRMYLDFLQNRPQATIAAPYSARPKPGATVSTPLHWDEVQKGLSMQDFTINTIMDRLKTEGDLFKPVLGKGIDMQKALEKLEAAK